MSRAALARQQGNIEERERLAQELFDQAVEEGRQRQRQKSILPLWGPDDSFHFNPLLLRNTVRSTFFQKCVRELHEWSAVIDEIYYQVKSLTPFAVDKQPSSAFCLLLRLLTLRMTDHQMDLTLKHSDSPYIRGIGFLYLRYAGPPEQVYRWIAPFLQDEEEIQIETRSSAITIGQFVRELFQSREFHGTPLPRFPIQVERELQVQLYHADKVAQRAIQHHKNQNRMQQFQRLGSQVMALYGDEENPITWYRAVVDRVITRDDVSGVVLKYPKFVVTFTEYGNTETVTLGELDVLDGDWRHDRPPSVDHGEAYEQIRRRERDAVTAHQPPRRPPSTKSTLSSQTRHNAIVDEPITRRPKALASSHPLRHESEAAADRKRKPEELAAIADKKRKLMSKYG